jgi:hypothetical protein
MKAFEEALRVVLLDAERLNANYDSMAFDQIANKQMALLINCQTDHLLRGISKLIDDNEAGIAAGAHALAAICCVHLQQAFIVGQLVGMEMEKP